MFAGKRETQIYTRFLKFLLDIGNMLLVNYEKSLCKLLDFFETP